MGAYESGQLCGRVAVIASCAERFLCFVEMAASDALTAVTVILAALICVSSVWLALGNFLVRRRQFA